MTTILTCIGSRDPYDDANPRHYGAALACAQAYPPSKIFLITTLRTKERAEKVGTEIQKVFLNCRVHLVDTQLENPSDTAAVDRCFRKLLGPIARTETGLYVNLSSGTPQMTMILGLLLSTGFLDGKGIRVEDPRFQKRNSTEEFSSTQAPLSETFNELKNRLSLSADQSRPIIENVIRSNAIELINRFDYSGAELLLCRIEQRPGLRKKYSEIILPVLSIGKKLLLIDLAGFRECCQNLPKVILENQAEKIEQIKRVFGLSNPALLYLASEIRMKTERWDDFIRTVGLTREACLEQLMLKPEVKAFYESAFASGRNSFDTLNLDSMIINYPELLEFIKTGFTKNCFAKNSEEASIQFQFKKEQEFTPAMKELVLEFAASRNPELLHMQKAIDKTKEVRNLRNSHSHSIKAPSKDIQAKISAEFKKLFDAFSAQEQQVMKENNPFLICNDILNEELRYWAD